MVDVGTSPVAVLHWPEEAELRRAIDRRRGLRLLLVARQEVPPLVSDVREDWVRLPASDADIEARIEGLAARSLCPAGDDLPEHDRIELDGDGCLHRGVAWVALSTNEAAIMAALLSSDGAVVSREELAEAAWPGNHPNRNVLDVYIGRLRRRIEPLGLVVRTVRSRGYALVDPAAPSLSETRQASVPHS